MAWNHSENPKYVLALSLSFSTRFEKHEESCTLIWAPYSSHWSSKSRGSELSATLVCMQSCSCYSMSHHSLFQTTATQAAALRCHIYDNQSIIHLLGLPLPCVDPTAMLPAHIWLHGAPLSPGWDLPLVMGHLGGQMKPRLDEGFVYYGYGALWRHWQLHIDSLLSRRPTSAVVLILLSKTQHNTHTQKPRALNLKRFCLLLCVLDKLYWK